MQMYDLYSRENVRTRFLRHVPKGRFNVSFCILIAHKTYNVKH